MAAWREHSPEHLARRGHARLVLYSFCLLSGSVPQADRRAIIGHAEPCLLSMIKIRIIRNLPRADRLPRVLVVLAGEVWYLLLTRTCLRGACMIAVCTASAPREEEGTSPWRGTPLGTLPRQRLPVGEERTVLYNTDRSI